MPEITVVGYYCTYEGQKVNEKRIAAIKNWEPCKMLSEVKAYLGTVGVVWHFIKNFTYHAHPLVKLTRLGIPFKFGIKQICTQKDLMEAVINLLALRAINYKSSLPVIILVNTSYIVVGYMPAVGRKF